MKRESEVWRRMSNLAVLENDERVVVLDLSRLELPPYVFEGTAAAIWARIDGHHTVSQIATAVADAYEVGLDECADLTTKFVRELAGVDLLTPAHPGRSRMP